MSTTEKTVRNKPYENAAADAPKYRFIDSTIDWKGLNELGITRDKLKEANIYEDIMYGRATSKLITYGIQKNGVTMLSKGRLQLFSNDNGSTRAHITGVMPYPDLNKIHKGYYFKSEDKLQFAENGYLTGTRDLVVGGKREPCIVEIDKLTNQMLSCPVSWVKFKTKVGDQELQPGEIDKLKAGQEVELSDVKFANGPQDVKLRLSADTRSLQYIFENDIMKKSKINGVEITDENRQDWREGKAVLIENMTRRNYPEEKFDSYIHIDPVTKYPVYTNFDPFVPEEERVVIVPKWISHKELTEDERAQVATGNPTPLTGLIDKNNMEVDKWVQLDLYTGQVAQSFTEMGLEEKQPYQVPDSLYGYKFKASEKGELQDGNSVKIRVKDAEGKMQDAWAKLKQDGTGMGVFGYDPDAKLSRATTERKKAGISM